MHRLPVVVLLHMVATCWDVHTVWVVFCVGLQLEKLGLLELARHGWLLVTALALD